MSETADFFKWREDWMRFIAVPNRHGNYDVAIVVDGGYGLADALRNAEDYRRKLAAAMAADGLPMGVPLDPITLRPQLMQADVEDVA